MNPFLGLVLLMGYCAKTIGYCLSNPIRALFMFFPVPIALIALDASTGTQLMAMDAIIGVGAVSLIFLDIVKRSGKLNDGFLVSFLVLLGYGLLRFKMFGAFQLRELERGLELIREQLPTMLDNAMFTDALPMWKLILPAVWIITQGLSLTLGFILLQKLLGIKPILQNFSFPPIYNLMIIAIIPLYLFEATKMLFANALLAMCVIPFLHGMANVWQKLSLVFSNRIVLGIFMFIIIIYANVLLVLIGFADMWLNKRKEIPGGITA